MTDKNTAIAQVFFYGLFMDADDLRARGFHPENEQIGRIEGMTLRIGQRAAIAVHPFDCVYGFVMDMTKDELDRLYADASVSAYRAEPVTVHVTSGQKIPALCYNLTNLGCTDERNPIYVEKLCALAGKLGLPKSYIVKLSHMSQ